MAKILVMGAGSAQANGVINCLLDCQTPEDVIGAGCEPTDLVFASCKRKFLIPHSTAENYREKLLKLLAREKPDLIHFQHDMELFIASGFRDDILAAGTRLYIPDHQTIETCVYKQKSYQKFRDAGITVPENLIINRFEDLKAAFDQLGDDDGRIWLRSTGIGGGGLGSLPTNDLEFARRWIDSNEGWGDFSAAEMLTPRSVTWLSIWYKGELVVGQGRIRRGWSHSSRAVSGVTGVTKVGCTYSKDDISDIAIRSVNAVSKVPHGVYGVDMTYDRNEIPNHTEINIGRFFTTVEFFKQAGLNMPEILKDIAVYDKFPELKTRINPLENNLLWLRAMDHAPVLVADSKLKSMFETV